MAPPKSDWEKQMLHLDSEIRRLEAEFNMFFAGRLPRPPWETKTRVTALIKKHENTFIRNIADRFRFESLQNRYQKFSELCDRQLTNRELGRPMLGVRRGEPKEQQKTPAAPAAPAATVASAERTERIVRVGRNAGDAAVKELYEQLAAARKAVGETPLDYDRVAALARAQLLKFGADGAGIAFTISTRDGKVQLAVKVEKSGED